MPSLYGHSLSTWVLSLLLGSYCLVASTGYGLGIIYNQDGNNDDVSPVLSMFMLFVLLITRLYVLIRIWRTTQENSATTILYGSGLG
jgi:Na+/proline symporter